MLNDPELILLYVYYHVINETDGYGKTHKFNIYADEFHNLISNGTLVSRFPKTRPYIEEYEKRIVENAAMILTRPYRLHDTDVIERLLKVEK